MGEVDESRINDMSYVWFNSVLKALGKRLAFESISNLYGNSFAKDANKYIQKANPLVSDGHSGGGSVDALTGKIKIVKFDENNKKSSMDAISQMAGQDISWIGDFREKEKQKNG